MRKQFPALSGFLNLRLLLGVSLFLIGTYLAWISFAANPTSGSISTASSPIAWDGTAAAGASATGEMTCVEQMGVHVNCDTFTLTVIGTPADWAGKDVKVEISWVVLASDYDLYVHKGSNAGPTIGQSTGGAPGTNEVVKIQAADLDASGTSVFTAHVVYSSAAAGDQYHGVASVETVGRRSDTYARANREVAELEDQLSRPMLRREPRGQRQQYLRPATSSCYWKHHRKKFQWRTELDSEISSRAAFLPLRNRRRHAGLWERSDFFRD